MNDVNMENIKKINLEILKDFDRFCTQYDIKYSISFGTALGAKRHGGFIPWDDDIDVDMHIDEYKKCESIT